MSPDPVDHLTDSCREALGELREVCQGAKVVAVHGDWAFISLGHFDLRQINDIYKQDQVLGVIRIPKDFPQGPDPYGIITVPYLERSDGQQISKQDKGHQKASAVSEAFDTDDIGFWSWKWDGVSRDSPGALRKAPAMVRKRLSMEE